MAAKPKVKKAAQPKKPRKAPAKRKPQTIRADAGVPGKGKPSRTKALAVPLTEGQRRFIRLWMIWRNARRAYAGAYPEAGYETCHSEGSKLFRDPRIATRIKELLATEAASLTADARRVTERLAAMAFTSPADMLTDQGNMLQFTELDRPVALAVKKFKRKEMIATSADGAERVIGHTIEVEMHDPIQPLRLLGLELGMFKEKVELGAGDALLEALRKGRERSLAAPD